MVHHRRPPNRRRAAPAIALAMCAAALVAASPALAQAPAANPQETPQEKSMRFAKEGAGHFKAKQYLKAARLFQEAYRISPTNPVMLRYAGRGWQEVGHWERARQLLEHYYRIEKNPNNKATILKHLAVLRGATPLVIAERLRFATQTYPGQGLERDAGFAFEKLGELRCKQGKGAEGVKALTESKQFFEVARLAVKTPAERTELNTAVQRVEGKVDKCKPFCAEKLDGPWCADDKTLITCVGRKAKATKSCDSRCVSGGPGQPGKCLAPKGPVGPVGPGPGGPAPGGSGGLVKYIIGGALLVVGGGAAGFGILKNSNADTDYKNDGDLGAAKSDQWVYKTYDDYKDDKATAGLLQTAGLATAVVGAGVITWAILSGGGDDAKPAKKATWLTPVVGRESVGFALGGRF